MHPGADRWHALVGSQYSPTYGVNKDGRIIGGITQNHTPYFGGFAETFVENRAGQEAAWFCYLNWTDPHGPHTPLKAFEHAHDGERYSSPGTRETDFSDKGAYWGREEKHGPSYHHERYEGALEELEGVDYWVDRLFAALERTGQLESTIVVFTSDNGFHAGEHGGMTGKSAPYEESARVPFLIRGPGVPATAGPSLVSHLDLTATILTVANAQTDGTDGRDLRGLGGPWRERLLVEHPGGGWAMVREGDAVYMDFGGGDAELYDLSADPYQLESLHRDPERAGQIADLRAKLRALKGATGDALRTAEAAPEGAPPVQTTPEPAAP